MTPTMVNDTPPHTGDTVTRHVVGQVVNAIASRDWQSLARVVSDSVIYWRPGTGDRVDGLPAYIDEWRTFIQSTASLTYRPHTVLVEGDTAMVEATADGTWQNGTPLQYSMVSVLRVADGKLVEEREYIVPRTR